MEINELSELTTKRLGMLSEVEFIFSINQLPDHKERSQELLEAIHAYEKANSSRDDERIGRALRLYLFTQSQSDILLHQGL